MPGRIIFLDIDGVLNSSDWSQRRGDPETGGMSTDQRRAQRIDPDAVARLDRLVARSAADVVLCSAWRASGVESMRRVLALRGFRGRLIDRTPVRQEHDLELFRRLHGKPAADPSPWPRGYELQQWLDARPEIESIVILDDCASMKHLSPWQVRTSMRDGLLDEHVERALEILRRPGPPRSQGLSGSVKTGSVIGSLRELEGEGVKNSAGPWLRYLDCFDRWWRWIELGREAEARGDTSEADACFAAGCWLQPESAAPVVARAMQKRSSAPDRPDPDFPRRPAAERHRLAWELGRRGLDELPTLLRWSCDPSPAVRACIYRALGRIGHPAAIQALHEGVLDPDHHARLAALHSLGRCHDPTAIDWLPELAGSGLSEAMATRDRIIAYWTDNAKGTDADPRDHHYHAPDPSSLLESPGADPEFEARRMLRFSGHGTKDQRRARAIRVLL